MSMVRRFMSNIHLILETFNNLLYYILGSDHLFAPMREIITASNNSTVVVGCRPTSPDIKVELTSVCIDHYNISKLSYINHI